MALTRDQILKKRELPRVKVAIPEWADTDSADAYVYVRALTGRERDAWEQSLSKGKGKTVTANLENIRAKAAVASCVGDDGARLFEDSDITALGEQASAPLHRIFDEFMKINGLSKEHVEELAGESSPGQN